MAQKAKRRDTRLHCQHCAKPRAMLRFLAINTEQVDGEKNVYPFKIRRFLDLVNSKTMVKLPRFYSGTCGTCLKNTFYQGQNRGTKLEVIAS